MIGPGGERRPATVLCDVRHWSEGGFGQRECSIQLCAEGFDIHSAAWDFFEAFCGVRDQLAAHGFYPLCYGASRNVHPSGMLRDMAAGRSAYKVQMGRPARMEDLVDIFETGPDVEVATVAVQRAFWSEWFKAGTK